MPRVAPFVGLRYDTDVAGPLEVLTAPPYDVISEPHRARFLDASPSNVVHLDLAAGSTDPTEPDNRYARAGEDLRSWEATGVLRRDREPTYSVYAIDWPATDEVAAGRLRGVCCALALEPWGGSVIPHEQTMPGPILDRLEHLRSTGTHLSPIYATARGPLPELAAALDELVADQPSADMTDEEGVRHRLWIVPGDLPIATWLAEEELLIADGHHRYTTALAYRDERHAVDGPGPWDAILAFVVDAGTQTVPVLPYHRVQLTGSVPMLAERADGLGALRAAVSDQQMRVGVIEDSAGTLAFGVLTLDGEPPVVRALHHDLLDAIAPGDALRFTHSARDAEEAVRTGGAVAAYVLPPTTPERVRTAIAHGARLPRKSTFFWPKPRTGLVFMPVR